MNQQDKESNRLAGFVGIIFVINIVFWLIYWAIKLVLIALVFVLGLITVSVFPIAIAWISYQTVQALIQRDFELTRAILLPGLTVLIGVTLACLAKGITSPLVTISLWGSGFSLTIFLLYPSLNRRRLIRQYQKKEKHLINS